MKPELAAKRLNDLVRRLRSGILDDPGRTSGWRDKASYLIDHNPPGNWNYMAGRTWSEKWIISMCLGPYGTGRAQEVMAKVLKAVRKRRLAALKPDSRLPFPRLPGDWQWRWTFELGRYLRDWQMSEKRFFKMLRQLDGSGLAARAALRTVCGAWGATKTIDYFIREALDLPIIPVDRHVRRVLAAAGLETASHEELLLACRRIGVRPQRVARALYRAYSPPRG